METQTSPLLSKWWQSESAQAAMQRAVQRKKEAIAKMREAIVAKKAELARQANEWKVVA